MKITALAGGTGAAKLLRGLLHVVAAKDLTIIVNTGDDLSVWGLSVSPDIDTITYTLAGLVDEAKGWGVEGDSFVCRAMMGKLGEPTFMALGDRDLALHIHRTRHMHAGEPLSRVTDRIRRALGVEATVLPMCDERVRTLVRAPSGWLGFQEFFVRDRCEPEVVDIAFEGAAGATPAPGVVDAIVTADAVIVCPSNPVSSIGPILAIPGIARALEQTRRPVIAVSPIRAGAAVSGPAGKMMAAKGYELSCCGVADAYRPWLGTLVIDQVDTEEIEPLAQRGVVGLATDTLMTTRADEIALAKTVHRAIE